jgi:hypothetical protein
MYYQAKMFADTPAAYLKEFSSASFDGKLSLAEIRALLKARLLDYSIEFIQGVAPGMSSNRLGRVGR